MASVLSEFCWLSVVKAKMSRGDSSVVNPSVSFECTFIGALLKSESVLKEQIQSLAKELDETKKKLTETEQNLAVEQAMQRISFDAYVDEMMEAEKKIELLESELKKHKPQWKWKRMSNLFAF